MGEISEISMLSLQAAQNSKGGIFLYLADNFPIPSNKQENEKYLEKTDTERKG
jgi:hypothetical protein